MLRIRQASRCKAISIYVIIISSNIIFVNNIFIIFLVFIIISKLFTVY